ncbi:type VII secretion target [Actinokineospora auranticolor]|uniref:Excreted virulence factor EspC (Type VII ESX diderm) n=1 Tax=Actinokineospora auranticolor TaxID=155976 RepID=A0A2S6GDE7_9PSEU|nr:type VII secretion target [Actinokineospora auranticolor]PPK63268.1 excreted virulence factor EspC (type VII ESX diderm) [Actinokineospora auranticolor]
MTQGGFDIGADLGAHAGQLDGCVGELRRAVEAANTVSMPTDAYGILCQPFRMLLDPVEQFGIDALSKAVEAMDTVATQVRETARAYQSTEDANVSNLKAGD